MKKYPFSSKLKEDLELLLEQKHSLGYPYVVSSQILLEFDRFCLEHFPDAETITPDIAMCIRDSLYPRGTGEIFPCSRHPAGDARLHVAPFADTGYFQDYVCLRTAP